MYSWSTLLNESQKQITPKNPNAGVAYLLGKKTEFIQRLSEITNRNTILYFSAFMHKPKNPEIIINDKDINALMENVHRLDKEKGLDIILHTPGGDLAATEQIIYYLKSYFNSDIRAIVPQMAMSAGSLIAVSCKSIIMGRQSCIGPFDPQLNGVPCQSVLREFKKAIADVEQRPASLGLWQTIISKLNPTFITLCEQADELSEELTEKILSDKGLDRSKKEKIKKVFSKNDHSKTHSRHIDRTQCKKAGLSIIDLEDEQEVQDLVLGIHHCCMILGEQSNIVKIVENNIGGRYQLHGNN
ncbi:MAG: serine protease [Bacteroidetes bacterium]|jgi:ClpP class serine protease|nr:serine protease [Bacteroidota bacterium]MBQ9509696.1 ATP-dependent Clp protease proteolytic subunit [Bacteroidales bacterium]